MDFQKKYNLGSKGKETPVNNNFNDKPSKIQRNQDGIRAYRPQKTLISENLKYLRHLFA